MQTYTALTRILSDITDVVFTSADVGKTAQFGEAGEFFAAITSVVSSSSVVLASDGTLPTADTEVIDLVLVGDDYVAPSNTYAGYIAEIQSMIKDGAGKLTTTTGGDLDRVLAKAVTDYSKAKPLVVKKKIQGNGSDSYVCSTVFADLWAHGFSSIAEIEYPIGSKPRTVLESTSYELYDDGTEQDGTNIALRMDSIIGATEYFIVSLTTPMSLPVTGAQNFPNTTEHFSNITTLASAYACQRLAAVYAQSVDATISADSVNYNDKSSKYQGLAKQYMRQYNLAVFGSEDPTVSVAAAMQTRVIDSRMANGSRYIFHRERR